MEKKTNGHPDSHKKLKRQKKNIDTHTDRQKDTETTRKREKRQKHTKRQTKRN